jgi:mannose-1-phosphate guanylyltransferase
LRDGLMKAMILAAGLGTRVEPLRKIRPKSLFPVLNQPLLGIIIEQLKSMGTAGIIINAHHLAEQVEQFVGGGRWGVEVEVRVEPEILGTGGGIKNCADFLHDAPLFVVANADVYHTFDLRPALNYHREADNLATLILCDHPRFNQLGIDAEGSILSVRGQSIKKSLAPSQVLAFTGIHIISPQLLGSMTSTGFFGIMEFYMELASRGEAIRGYRMQGGYWRDIGRVADYMDLHRDLLVEKGEPALHPEVQLAEAVRMEGFVCVGRGSRIGAGASLTDSILWEDVVVEEGSVIEGCVVGDGTRVRGRHHGETLIPG